jgi:hypothetical protein
MLEQQQKLARTALDAPQPAWLEQHRTELAFDWDASSMPLRDTVARLLGVEIDLEELHTLGKALPPTPPLYFKLAHAFKAAGVKLPKKWKRSCMAAERRRQIVQLESSELWRLFIEQYKQFVHQVVVPLCGGGRVWFQCPPTLRIQLHGMRKPTLRMHCDGEFEKHEGGEINFWVPCTSVEGTRSLFVESSPGQADFHPVGAPRLEYGQAVRFNGNRYVTHM